MLVAPIKSAAKIEQSHLQATLPPISLTVLQIATTPR